MGRCAHWQLFLESERGHDLPFGLLECLLEFLLPLRDLQRHPFFNTRLKLVRLVEWQVALGVHNEGVRVESECDLGYLDLGVEVTLVSEGLLEGHDDLAEVKLRLQVNLLLHSRLRISDFSGTHVLEAHKLHDDLSLVEEQVGLDIVPLWLTPLAVLCLHWLDFERKIIDICIDLRQKHIFLNLALNVL